jgi:hypothetical protein
MREPTVHFAVLAGCFFAIGIVAKSLSHPVVRIDARSIAARLKESERALGRSLNDDERVQATKAYIDDQILAQEARLRGLDDDDRIRRILTQKMLHTLSAEVPQPTNAQLDAFFERNRRRYSGRATVTVDEVVVRANLGATSPTGFDPDSIDPDAVLRRGLLTRLTAGELSWSFGEATADLIFGAREGVWIGPHRSNDGDHWFRVVSRTDPTEPPSLEEIRDQVRSDWMAEQERALLDQRIAELRARYSVEVIPERPAP